MLNPVQRIFFAGGLTGLAIGAVTVALCYESAKKDEAIADLEHKNAVLAQEKNILVDKIQKLEKSGSEPVEAK